MRPSSSPSEGLFDGIFGRGPAAAEVTDVAWLQAMLDVEAALARASARAGLFPEEVAEAITACCVAERFDIADLGRAAADSGNPVVPVVAALTSAVGVEAGPEAAGHVHRGATSQDVLDSATMLIAKRALDAILVDLAAAAARCAELAATHADVVMPGRTLLQPAMPTTFGLKAAGWLTAIDAARLELAAVRDRTLAVQLGGAAGTLASLGPIGPEVVDHLATLLGLCEPILPWHSDRTRVVVLAGALALSTGVLAKIGRDVTLLSQAEVAEASEGGDGMRGSSSTMPNKRNPVASVTLVACGQRAPGPLATIVSGMPQEHERGSGGWHAEWEPTRELLRLAGSSAAWGRDLLENLQIDAGRMRANLEALGGFPLAENVTSALTATLGRGEAHRLVESTCHTAVVNGMSLREALVAEPAVLSALGEDGIDAALDPLTSLTAVPALLARAMDAHESAETALQWQAE
jgi:3-carboxy-cis,cis-muconate cycloisomerase